MSLYGECVVAVNTYSEQRERALHDAAVAARRANLDATRAALRALVPPDDPMRPVAELLAAALTIGRDDDYPSRTVSDDAQQAFAAAIRALGHVKLPPSQERHGGLLDVLSTSAGDYESPMVNLDRITRDQQDADYRAWGAHRDYVRTAIKLT